MPTRHTLAPLCGEAPDTNVGFKMCFYMFYSYRISELCCKCSYVSVWKVGFLTFRTFAMLAGKEGVPDQQTCCLFRLNSPSYQIDGCLLLTKSWILLKCRTNIIYVGIY